MNRSHGILYKMSTIWNEPRADVPRLYLPIIDHSNWAKDAPLPKSSEYFVKVDQSFLDIWLDGPVQKEGALFYEDLLVICRALTGFFESCESLNSFSTKEAIDDHVTIVDTGIEWLIRHWLHRFFPEDNVIGEEGPKPIVRLDQRFWIVDPLDGTSNFIHKRKDIAFNLAAYENGTLVFSCILNPMINLDLYGYLSDGHCISSITSNQTEERKIGTEYRDKKTDQHYFFEKLKGSYSMEGQQLKSISVNMATLLSVTTPLFYKPKAKIWDIIAPLGLFHFAGLDTIFPHIYYSFGKASIDDLCDTVHIHTIDTSFIDHINTRLIEDSRIGLCLMFHQSLTDIRNEILDYFIGSD